MYCKQNNIKLNKSKLESRKTEVKFMGHIFTREGIKIDKEKTEAIEKFPKPRNIKELRRFLGLSNYLSRYIENYQAITAPLQQLLMKYVEFTWPSTQEKAHNNIIQKLTTAPTLSFYDTEKELSIESDASEYGK